MLKALENILQSEIDPAFAKRARLIFELVEKIKPQKILDAGCGRGFYLNSLTNFKFIKEIHGFDVNEKYLNIASQNLQFHFRHFERNEKSSERKNASLDSSTPKLIARNDTNAKAVLKKASIYNIPYSDNYFDFIICSEVLEHLKDDKKALRELKRVLKKGGTLVITVPNKSFPLLWDPLNWILMRIFNTHVNKNIWWLAGIWADHERLYTKEEIKNLVNASGFTIEKSQEIIRWCWPFSHFMLYGIGKNIIEHFGFEFFNRFHSSKQNYVTFMLASLFRFPTRFDMLTQSRSSMNIIIFLHK